MDSIKQQFEELKASENWTEMGWFFWRGFMDAIDNPMLHGFYSGLWDSLTHEQQNACEEV